MSTPETDAIWDSFSKGGHINHDAVFSHARNLELVRDELLNTFRHTHVSNGHDDACKRCGLDLRSPIHDRIKQAMACAECKWTTWDQNVKLCFNCGSSNLRKIQM